MNYDVAQNGVERARAALKPDQDRIRRRGAKRNRKAVLCGGIPALLV